ncbi:integrase core domain-containing protein [Paracoccus sulfuroxidans]|uniref:integrase core domain-containing protein n=1 Tax=Paracoccus sulfuroxidans TaxID=384678 RepID=UPI0024118F57|nr:integrase core domain-containing protein [Paracoccus sulfuroxidans]
MRRGHGHRANQPGAGCPGRGHGDQRYGSRRALRHRLAAWRTDYNTERPHSRLGWQTPAQFAQTFTPQRGLTLRNLQSSAPAPVAQPAQVGKTQARSLAHAG